MKVLLISPRYYPEQFSITNVAEELARRGNSVTVLTGMPIYGFEKPGKRIDAPKIEEINGVRVCRYRERRRKKGALSLAMNYFSIYYGISHFLRHNKDKFDVVFSHVLSPIFVATAANKYCKKSKTPHMHYGLDLWPESLIAAGATKRNSLFYQMMLHLSRKTYKRIDAIAFSSPSAKSYFRDILQIDKVIQTIYQPCLENDVKLRQPAYDDAILHLLYCGSVTHFLNISLLPKAIALLSEAQRQRVHIDIVGNGSSLEKLKDDVSIFRVGDQFTFHDRVPSKETIHFYERSDVVFVPLSNTSRTALLIPQKLLETMRLGKPILGMINGDGRDLIEKSGGGIICEETAEDLAKSISSLITMPKDQIAKMGVMNRDFFYSNACFSLPFIVSALEDEMKIAIENYSKR